MSGIGSKGKVLILDDEEMVGELTSHMLSHLGYQSTLVKEGGMAVSEYQQKLHEGEPYDLVIMDLLVPMGMGGKEASRKILAIDPAAKIVVSSGLRADPVMTDYADYGFAGAIPKPFDLGMLQDSLDAFIATPA